MDSNGPRREALIRVLPPQADLHADTIRWRSTVVYQALHIAVMGEAGQSEALQRELRLGIECEGAEQPSDQHTELESVPREARRDDDAAPAGMVVEDEILVGGDVVHAAIHARQLRLRRAR